MRHRVRSRSTHDATFERRDQIGTDDLGEALYDWVVVASDVSVRYNPGGDSFVQEATGERVHKSPTIDIPADLEGEIEANVRVDIDGVEGRFQIVNVRPKYGRGRSPSRLRAEVTRIDA